MLFFDENLSLMILIVLIVWQQDILGWCEVDTYSLGLDAEDACSAKATSCACDSHF